MPKVSMINSTIKNIATDFTRYARFDKSFAERLVFHNNIRGHISNKAITYDLGFDIFDREGKITNEGLDNVLDIIKSNKLKRDATWFDAIKASHKIWQNSKNPAKNNYTIFDFMISPYTII